MTVKLVSVLGGLIAAIAAFIAMMSLHVVPATPTLGAAGPDQYAFVNLYAGYAYGQGINASSTKASVTLSGLEFLNADTLDYTINQGPTATLTLPASTTAMCASLTKGEKRDLFVKNATTTATATLTIAGGTGFNLLSASTSKAITASTGGVNTARLTVQKLASTDCNALLVTFVP